MTAPADPPRRELTYAVLLCVAGAGLALFAATRTWAVELTARPAPLSALREARTGDSLLPWLPALAVVALAGAGAVVAARGGLRLAVGLLLAGTAVGVVGGGGYGLLVTDRGEAGSVAVGWPLLCLLGGLAVLAGAGWTVARGRAWPSLGARYERARTRPAPSPVSGEVGSGEVDGDTRRAWEALDRGDDPTVG